MNGSPNTLATVMEAKWTEVSKRSPTTPTGSVDTADEFSSRVDVNKVRVGLSHRDVA